MNAIDPLLRRIAAYQPALKPVLIRDHPHYLDSYLARYLAGRCLGDRQCTKGGRVILDDAARPDERTAVAYWNEDLHFVSKGELFAEKGIAFLKRRSD